MKVFNIVRKDGRMSVDSLTYRSMFDMDDL
jgi:hypothetical protein